jgi:hypothetical protein
MLDFGFCGFGKSEIISLSPETMTDTATLPRPGTLKQKTRSNCGAGHGSQRRLVEPLYLVAGLSVRIARDASSVIGVRPASRALMVARVTPSRAASPACVRPSRSRVSLYWVASISLPFGDWLHGIVDGHHETVGKFDFGLLVGKLANFGGLFGDVLLKDEVILDEVGDLSGGGDVLQCLHGFVVSFGVGVTQWQREEGKTLLHKPQEKKVNIFTRRIFGSTSVNG